MPATLPQPSLSHAPCIHPWGACPCPCHAQTTCQPPFHSPLSPMPHAFTHGGLALALAMHRPHASHPSTALSLPCPMHSPMGGLPLPLPCTDHMPATLPQPSLSHAPCIHPWGACPCPCHAQTTCQPPFHSPLSLMPHAFTHGGLALALAMHRPHASHPSTALSLSCPMHSPMGGLPLPLPCTD